MKRRTALLIALAVLLALVGLDLQDLALWGVVLVGLAAGAWQSTNWITRKFPKPGPGQLVFLWGLSSALVWGIFGLIVIWAFDAGSEALLAVFGIFCLAVLWVFVTLIRLTWPALGRSDAGNTVAAGVTVSAVMFLWALVALLIVREYDGLRGELANKAAASGTASAERVAVEHEEIAWPQPLPGVRLHPDRYR